MASTNTYTLVAGGTAPTADANDITFTVYANLSEPMPVDPGNVVSIPVGIILAIDTTFCAHVLPNAQIPSPVTPCLPAAVLPTDNVAEVQIAIQNTGENAVTIYNGQAIARLLFVAYDSGATLVEGA